MTYTIQQMNEARAAKRARRNRGEATGNHGIRQLNPKWENKERGQRDYSAEAMGY